MTTTLDTRRTDRAGNEPECARVEGHRIMLDGSTVLEYTDVYRYEDGSIGSVAVRREGHETIDGARVVYVAWGDRRTLADVVAGHIEFERGVGAYSSDHILTH